MTEHEIDQKIEELQFIKKLQQRCKSNQLKEDTELTHGVTVEEWNALCDAYFDTQCENSQLLAQVKFLEGEVQRWKDEVAEVCEERNDTVTLISKINDAIVEWETT